MTGEEPKQNGNDSKLHEANSKLTEAKTKLAEANSQLDQANNKRLIKIFIIVIIPAIIASFLSGKNSPPPEACDMNIAENRDFNKYYGILNTNTHFTTPNADYCDSNIIFKPVLPQAILNSHHTPSSFLTLAPFGTGKTVLRCEYYKSLSSNTYFK
ncbi:unnamed protein product, partial [Adineta steineri]